MSPQIKIQKGIGFALIQSVLTPTKKLYFHFDTKPLLQRFNSCFANNRKFVSTNERQLTHYKRIP